MWTIGLPHWSEFLVRAGVVYLFLLILLRMTGKRQVGQMAPFDLVLLLVLSNAVQNSMNGGDNSLVGGLISAATLVGINWVVSWMTFRSKRLEQIIEGRPTILIHDGKIDQKEMSRAQMTQHELNAALRAYGVS
ncbi:MAG: YetF domain-containing protein, partial [Pseudomonadota bacterium]